MRIRLLPQEIRNLAFKEQLAQGQERPSDPDIDLSTSILEGNFSWFLSKDGEDFWREINEGNFNIFWPKYGWIGYELRDNVSGATYRLTRGVDENSWFFTNRNGNNDQVFGARLMDNEYISRRVLGYYDGGLFPSCRTPKDAITLFEAAINRSYISNDELLLSPFFEGILKKLNLAIAVRLLTLNAKAIGNEFVRNIDIDAQNKRLTFLPKGKRGEYQSKAFLPKNRQSGKIGRVIKGVLKAHDLLSNINDSNVELFVDRVTAIADKQGGFSILSGNEIAKYYSERYHNNKVDLGSLKGSCMRGVPSNYFDIYSKNPDLVKLVVLFKDERVVGRALLWDNKYLDRVYGSGVTQQKFFELAQTNGWYRKYKQTYNEKETWVNPHTGNTETITTKFNIKNFPSQLPYLDTFSFMHPANKEVSNTKRGMTIFCQDLHGGYSIL